MNASRFLYPQICSLRSKMRQSFVLRGEGGRDLIFLLFFIALEIGTFVGTSWVLETINQNPNLIFLQPAQPLSLFLTCLLIMTFLAALMTAYDSYYQAYDLDLLFASPVNLVGLYLGRFLSVFFSVSWMPMLLLIPVIAAFGQAYHGGALYYLSAGFVFIPYFLVPSALGVVIATLFARYVPRSRSREFLILLAIGVVFLIGWVLNTIHQLWMHRGEQSQLLIVLQLITKGEVFWSPSYWTARVVESLLLPQSVGGGLFFMLSIFSSLALLSLGYALFESLHLTAFDKIRSRHQSSAGVITAALNSLVSLLPIRNSSLKALLRKEALLFSREITQIIQFSMMASLVLLYLINLRTFIVSSQEPGEIGIWYQRFTFIGNFSVGAFISIAACTRLVFPSLSLEGRSFWILQSAPISFASIIRVKFLYWLTPVALLTVTLFAVSAVAIGMSPLVAFCYGSVSLCIAYGVVGSACGLGAMYARFDWESPSQLCAGFGSLMYMLYSSALVTLTMVPTWFFLFRSSATVLSGEVTPGDLRRLALNCALVLLINHAGARWAMRGGERALERMRAATLC